MYIKISKKTVLLAHEIQNEKDRLDDASITEF